MATAKRLSSENAARVQRSLLGLLADHRRLRLAQEPNRAGLLDAARERVVARLGASGEFSRLKQAQARAAETKAAADAAADDLTAAKWAFAARVNGTDQPRERHEAPYVVEQAMKTVAEMTQDELLSALAVNDPDFARACALWTQVQAMIAPTEEQAQALADQVAAVCNQK